MVEDKIVSLGGKFEKADKPFGVSIFIPNVRRIFTEWTLQIKVVVDGKLITGQNPASAGPIAEAILKALQ